VTLMPEAESKSIKGGNLRTTVPIVPDAPIGHFRLNLFGGKRGYLVNTRSLCVSPVKIGIKFSGHNGRRMNKKVKIETNCGG
jgi:hypothetical protein